MTLKQSESVADVVIDSRVLDLHGAAWTNATNPKFFDHGACQKKPLV